MASQIVDEAAPRGDVLKPARQPAARIESSTPEDSRPVTLAEASDSIEHKNKQWNTSKAPTYAAWMGLSRKLARAEQAIGAIAGLHDTVRQHHFASQVATESEAEYIGITDYQAACMDDAIHVLTWEVVYALNDLREAVSAQGGR